MRRQTQSLIFSVLLLVWLVAGCAPRDSGAQEAASGVTATSVDVPVSAAGTTIEQENVGTRLQMDNQIGSIKHLYVISAFSGDVLLYSTVQGKVTSSGKRLTPTSVAAIEGQYVREQHEGLPVRLGDRTYRTSEVLQDDGTYGTSIPYLFWWDAQGKYHQHYVSGGQILHISDQPISVGEVRINMSMEVVTPGN